MSERVITRALPEVQLVEKSEAASVKIEKLIAAKTKRENENTFYVAQDGLPKGYLLRVDVLAVIVDPTAEKSDAGEPA